MALREMIEGLIASGPGSEERQERRFGAMLDVVAADRAILFGMESDRYNFAIYIYEPVAQRLDCVACRRPIRAEEEAVHRSWEPGEGHVGLAFQIKREVVARDTSDPAAQALFDAPAAKRREDDRDRYRSIASIPQDVSEATRLIRERADRMMPSIFRRLRAERAERRFG